MGTPQEAPLLSAGEPNRRRRLIYIRHFEQSSHACADPPLKRSDENIANPGPYDRIICSPYLRCRATAQLINDAWAGGERPITVDVRLAEFQGAKTRKRFKLDATSRQFGEVAPPQETWAQCAARLDAHLAYARSLSGTTLVVTHGVVVRYAQHQLQGQTRFARGRNVPFGGGFSE